MLIDNAKNIIIHICNWYIQEYISYIMIFGTTITPHIFPKYLPDSVL
jgi:hypothetical protein